MLGPARTDGPLRAPAWRRNLFRGQASEGGRSPPPSLPGAAAADQADDRHEQCRSDDRPDDGEGFAADGDREELREMEASREPGSDEGPDEAEGNRDETAPPGAAPDGLTNRSADTRDHEQKEELEQGHRALPPRVPEMSGMVRSRRGWAGRRGARTDGRRTRHAPPGSRWGAP